MRTRGALMIEHRLIERLLAVVDRALARGGGNVQPAFVDAVVDFVQAYVDRTHHGKEENILFRALAEKQLSSGDRDLMAELVREHAYGREVTARLAEANERLRRGEAAAPAAVVGGLQALLQFYPKHIAKEDRDFFPAYGGCLSAEEERAMAEEFCDFDRKLIHEQYGKVCQDLDRQWGAG